MSVGLKGVSRGSFVEYLPASSPFWLVRVPRISVALGVMLLVHAGLRMGYTGVEPDDCDLLLYSQQLSLGYSEQPPLYSWLCEPIFRLFGVGIVAITLMKTAILIALTVSLYLAARLVTANERLATLAAGTVLIIPSLAWHSLAYLTHSNLLFICCLVTLIVALRIVRDGLTRDYLFLGLAVGAGSQSKYNYLWFVSALIAAGLTLPEVRRRILDRRIAVSIAIAAVLIAPHAIWLKQHIAEIKQVLNQKTTHQSHVVTTRFDQIAHGLKDAVVNSALIAVPTMLIVGWCFRRRKDAFVSVERDEDPFRTLASRWLERFFLVTAGLVAFLIFVLGVGKFHERWLQPFALVLPLWLFSRIEPVNIEPRRVRAYGLLLIGFAVAYTGARAIQVGIYAERPRGWYPMSLDMTELADAIRADVGPAPTIISSEREIGGNLLLTLPEARVCCTCEPLFPIPEGDGPIVIAWNINYGPQPPWLLLGEFRERYFRQIDPAAISTHVIAPRGAHGHPCTVAYTVIRR